MDSSTPGNYGQNFPTEDSGGQAPSVPGGDLGATEAGGVDPNVAMQFAAIGEDYGRGRSKKAMRTGVGGSAALCSAAIGCSFLGGAFSVAGIVLLGVAAVSLVRIWNLFLRTTLLDDPERAACKFRLQLTAGYIACGGLIVLGMGIVYLKSLAADLHALNRSHSANRLADPTRPDPVLYAASQGRTRTAQSPADDRSLTLEAYREAGMPAHERRWSGTDMTRAANALLALTQTDAGKFPRLESPRSGPLFARMTSEENIELLRNQSLPIDQRLLDALTFMQGSSAILKLYLASFHKDGTGSTELIEIYGAQLRLWVVISQILDAFIPTLDKNDRTYEVRMQGLEKFREGLEMAVAGTLQTLTERAAYDTAELKRLLGFMQQTYPALLPVLPPGSRQEAVVRLQSFRKDPAMADLNPELAALVDQVESSSESSSEP